MVNHNFVSVEFSKIFFPKPYHLAMYFQNLTLSNFPTIRYDGLDKKPYTMDFFFFNQRTQHIVCSVQYPFV